MQGEFRIVTESARYSLAGILGMLRETVPGEGGQEEPRYKLDPEYQRRHRWTVERKSRLIESFLMNVPVPPVFLYERELARFEVMDGRQRLTALSEFYANEFALTGLQYWSELDGRTYSQLPQKIRDGIDRRYISSVILLQETGKSEEQAAMLKKIVFERLNSGGVKLGSQETRNAIHDGPLNRLCLELSENQKFKQMWRIPLNAEPETCSNEDEDEFYNEPKIKNQKNEPTKRGYEMFSKMEDVELVLRFFAYRHIKSSKSGLNSISDFLDKFLIEGNRFPETTFVKFRSMFESTIEFLWDVFGADSFCMMDNSRTAKQPKKIFYDPMMIVANSNEVTPHYKRLKEQKKILQDEMVKMYKSKSDYFAGRRTNYSHTQERNSLVHEAFAAAINRIKNS